MYTAGIDTTSQFASFSLIESTTGKEILSSPNIAMGSQSAQLALHLTDLLHDAGIKWHQIQRWSVGTGPGSFTGIRVGIALVLGICTATQAVYRGVPTSLAMGLQSEANEDEQITVIHDGRQDEVIITRYHYLEGKMVCVDESTAIKLTELARIETSRFVVFAYDRIARMLPVLPATVIQLPHLEARFLCATPGWKWHDIEIDADRSLTPIYVRPPVFVKPRFNTVSINLPNPMP